MVRIMQIDAKARDFAEAWFVGLPSTSAFARIFPVSACGSGMRSYTLGSAWWQGDCGPYWGHKRDPAARPVHRAIATFRRARTGTDILSHDQIEAVADAGAPVTTLRVLARGRRELGRETRRRCSNSSAATCAGRRATCSIGRIW